MPVLAGTAILKNKWMQCMCSELTTCKIVFFILLLVRLAEYQNANKLYE